MFAIQNLRSVISNRSVMWLRSKSRLLREARNGDLCFLEDGGEIGFDAVSDSKHEFHGRITKSPVHEAQHGFRHAGFLGDGIIRNLSLFPFFTQKSNDLGTDGLVMAIFWHM